MGKPLAGEVVVLPFPQTDLQAGKRRPALIVANLTGDDPRRTADPLSYDLPKRVLSPRSGRPELAQRFRARIPTHDPRSPRSGRLNGVWRRVPQNTQQNRGF